jgi:predicted ABC-type transport system involved in lysophospholipase L1 biosynthesis ATPase subunit
MTMHLCFVLLRVCAYVCLYCVYVCLRARVCLNSGAGKSSSLDMLCGIEPPTRGAVTVEGKSTAEQLPDVHSRTALCPQLVRFLLVAFLVL